MSQIDISLAQFIDFTLKQGTARVNYVKSIKNQPPYHPSRDFWKQFRDKIKDIHENGESTSVLSELVESVHPTKRRLYTQAVDQYKKFVRQYKPKWFEPGKSYWSSSDIVVNSSADLGLMIAGQPYLVKMYLKEQSQPLNKRRADLMLSLLAESTHMRGVESAGHAILNVNKAQLFHHESEVEESDRIALAAEAQQFAFIWEQI